MVGQAPQGRDSEALKLHARAFFRDSFQDWVKTEADCNVWTEAPANPTGSSGARDALKREEQPSGVGCPWGGCMALGKAALMAKGNF